jgi:hypothetical protein
MLRSADHTENKVIAKYCWSVTSLSLRGRVFTEPMSRRRLHNPVVLLLHECIAGLYRAIVWQCVDMSQCYQYRTNTTH